MICFGCWRLVAKRACIKGGFHDVYALFHIVIHSVHARCLIKCLLGIFSLLWTPITLGFFIFPHQDHVWFIGCVFYTPCPISAFSMHWSCIAHSHLLHTPLLPLSCIGLYLVSSSQHVIFTLCYVAFCFVLGLSFIFSFISHPSCIIIIVRIFISCPCFSLTLCLFLTKRGRVYSREYTEEGSCAYPQGEKFYFLCTFVGGEIFFRGDAYTKREKTLC